MESFDKLLAASLNRYFTVLEHIGYIKDQDTYKLVLLGFIQEFLEEFSYYITQEDYNKISNIVSCIADSSCLVPYIEYKKPSESLNNYLLNIPIRIAEANDLRQTESKQVLRLINQ